jgi:hypothetical protein
MQEWLVGIVVVIAAFAVARRYAPASLKQWLRGLTARGARCAGWHALAARFEAKAASAGSCGDGCGSCGACGTSASPGPGGKNAISVEGLRKTAKRRD